MPEFKWMDSSETLDKKYAGKTIVYLESEEDVSILHRHWFFDWGEKIEFLAAGDQSHETGGSSGVRLRMDEDKKNGVESFGIVDRDTAFSQRKWDVLFETDDEKYRSASLFGKHIHALLRWEIENYLFDPDIIEQHIADHEKGRKTRPAKTVRQELYVHCHALIPVMAASILLHEDGKRPPGDGYGHDKNLDEIKKEALDIVGSMNKNRFDDYANRLLKFEEKTADDEKRFNSLLRIIDGKRLLERIKSQHKIKDDPRFHIARKIREQDRVPREIKDFLSSLNAP